MKGPLQIPYLKFEKQASRTSKFTWLVLHHNMRIIALVNLYISGPGCLKAGYANLGLKFNQSSCFSYSKEFSQQIPSGGLKATKCKM